MSIFQLYDSYSKQGVRCHFFLLKKNNKGDVVKSFEYVC